jgi:hypothetical protein
VDCDGLDAKLAASPLDAQRDLAAVGYEDLLEHVKVLVNQGDA